MFTGIVERLGTVRELRRQGTNLDIQIHSPFTNELKIDQSVAHNGVCLTVTAIDGDCYWVTAIDETLAKTNLGHLRVNDKVNLERCLTLNGRIDGHLVQGHVDQIGTCESIISKGGSWVFTFTYDTASGNVTVEKGSICVNGVSLTVFSSGEGRFSVAIIPYTYEHTDLHQVKEGDSVNLEFDIIGKYVARLMNGSSGRDWLAGQ